jgi:hypothetical protein
MPASWISAGVGALGLINSMTGSGGSPSSGYGSGVPYYTPTGQGAADTQWQQLLAQISGQNQNLPGMVNPALLSSLDRSLGINYNPLINAAGQAGSQYGQLAGQAGQTGSQLQQLAGGQQNLAGQSANLGLGAAGTGQDFLSMLLQSSGQLNAPLQGASSNILNASMDPQQALYNRTLGQVTDSSNAINSMYGLGTSPTGANATNSAINNFNIDWQNQQLQRMIQGGQAAGGLQGTQANILGGLAGTGIGAYGNLTGLGLSGLGQAGAQSQAGGNQLLQALQAYSGIPGYTLQSGQIPLAAQQTAAQAPGAAANTYLQGQGNLLSQLLQSSQPYSQYLNYGQGQATGATGAYQNYLGNINTSAQGLGSALSGIQNSSAGQGIGNWLGSLFGSGGGGQTGSFPISTPSVTDTSGGTTTYWSERSIKQDIRPIGRTRGGLTVYRFRYRPQFRAQCGDGERTGVMADEVERRFPAAIVRRDGFRHVRYDLIA